MEGSEVDSISLRHRKMRNRMEDSQKTYSCPGNFQSTSARVRLLLFLFDLDHRAGNERKCCVLLIGHWVRGSLSVDIFVCARDLK